MTKVKVLNFTISLDGYGAGPRQTQEDPMGENGGRLHPWMLHTKAFSKMIGKTDGSTGTDNSLVEKAFDNIGAWIMGRNMFGPIRGEWPDFNWKGWWGNNPPYHVPVYVLTHHERPPLSMEGDTTFYFSTKGIDATLEEAKKAANGKDIRIGGGVSTVRQFLEKSYIDEIHLAVSPCFLDSGEHLFYGLDMDKLGYEVKDRIEGELATHVMIGRK